MTNESFFKLKLGDIVQNLGSGNSYIVSYLVDDKVILTYTLLATHPDEWKLVQNSESCQEQ